MLKLIFINIILMTPIIFLLVSYRDELDRFIDNADFLEMVFAVMVLSIVVLIIVFLTFYITKNVTIFK